MAKRRLSKQQQHRIRKIQEERTRRAGKREQAINDQREAGELGPEQSGLIIAHYGQQLDVEALDGDHRGELFRCFVRANIDSLVTGDRVIWCRGDDNTGVIVARQDRHTLLQRPDNFGQLKPVAANIDHIVLVIAPLPEPHDNLIDRYLVAAENTEIPAVILMNKSDLLNDDNRHRLEPMLNRYRNLGYQVVTASAHHPDRHDDTITSLVSGRTSVFVGQSGVGKSSIIQTLVPEHELKVGAVSDSTGKVSPGAWWRPD